LDELRPEHSFVLPFDLPFPGCPSEVPLHSPITRASGASVSAEAADCALLRTRVLENVAASSTNSQMRATPFGAENCGYRCVTNPVNAPTSMPGHGLVGTVVWTPIVSPFDGAGGRRVQAARAEGRSNCGAWACAAGSDVINRSLLLAPDHHELLVKIPE
jgi:hypothetical protein